MSYTLIDNEIFEDTVLNIQEQSLLITLISYFNIKKGYAYPSYENLMFRSKIKSKPTLLKTLKSLEEKGYFTKETIKGIGCKYYNIRGLKINQVKDGTRFKNKPGDGSELNRDMVNKCTTTNTKTNTKTNNVDDESFNFIVQLFKEKFPKENIEGLKKLVQDFGCDDVYNTINELKDTKDIINPLGFITYAIKQRRVG